MAKNLFNIKNNNESKLWFYPDSLSIDKIMLIGVIMISIFELIDWIYNYKILSSLFPYLKPMGPGTSISFILFGAIMSLKHIEQQKKAVRRYLSLFILFIIFFHLSVIIEFFMKKPGFMEHSVFNSIIIIDNPELSNTSSISAFNFILIGSSLIFLINSKNNIQNIKKIIIVFCLFILLNGTIVLLGYLYDVPLLYNSTTTLIALPTSISFILFSLNIIMSFNNGFWPMRIFIGNSIRARLERKFVPIIIFIMTFYGWLANKIFQSEFNPALTISLLTVLLIIIINAFISRITHKIDIELEHAQLERKITENSLKESYNRNKAFLSAIPDLMFILDKDYKFVDYHSNNLELTNIPSESFMGKNIEEVIRPGLFKKLKHYLQLIIATSEIQIIHFPLTINQKKLVLEARIAPCSEDKFLFIIRDMTERKLGEEALQQSQLRLNEAQRIARLGSWELNIKTQELIWSDEVFRIFELDPAVFKASYESFLNAIHPEDRDFVNTAYTDSVKMKSPYTIVHRLLMADGRIKYVHEHCETIYDYHGIPLHSLGTIQDITDRKLLEEKISIDQRRLNSLLKISQLKTTSINKLLDCALDEAISLSGSKIGNIYVYDVEKNEFSYHITAPEYIKENFPPDLLKIYSLELMSIWKDNRQDFKPIIKNNVSNKNPLNKSIPDENFQIFKSMTLPISSDNKTVAVITVANKNTDYNDWDLSQLSVFMDEIWKLTERKRTEESLIQSELRFRELFDKAPVGYHEINIEGKIIQINHTELDMLGYNEEEMVDHYIWDFIIEKDICEDFTKAKLLGEETVGKSYERTFRCKNGRNLPVLIDDIILKNSKGEIIGFRSTLRDISERKMNELALKESNRLLEETLTELKEAQKQALQQERLRSLGQMASGIAHDINNSLMPILGYSDLLLSETNADPTVHKQLNIIRTASLDIKRTIERMREFYRPRIENEEFKKIDLNKVIQSSIDFTKHRWKDMAESQGKVIRVKTQLQSNLPFVMGDESEIREALTNLIINSSDAMPDGGLLDLKSYASDNEITLEIRDTGIGMDEETLSHCLDPFFSTKGEKGTGLGLSMVYGIVNRHQGRIEIESEKNKGTIFKLVFNINKINISKSIKADKTMMLPLKILCIDDNAQVRDLITMMLKKQNHRIVQADNGKTGLKLFFETVNSEEPFNAVITDLGMPYLDGKSVAESIKGKYPEMPIILMTGWGAFIEEGSIKSADYILKKPILIEDLNKALKYVINKINNRHHMVGI
jgi:PAS domain S-box-containing protein